MQSPLSRCLRRRLETAHSSSEICEAMPAGIRAFWDWDELPGVPGIVARVLPKIASRGTAVRVRSSQDSRCSHPVVSLYRGQFVLLMIHGRLSCNIYGLIAGARRHVEP